RNIDPTDPTSMWSVEIADLCQGNSQSVPGAVRFQNFFNNTMQTQVATYWVNNKGCQPVGATGITHYQFVATDGGQVDQTISVCGRGKNMELSLLYWAPQDSRGQFPWDLNLDAANQRAQGKSSMYLSARLPAPGGGTIGVGSSLRNPADSMGFGNI